MNTNQTNKINDNITYNRIITNYKNIKNAILGTLGGIILATNMTMAQPSPKKQVPQKTNQTTITNKINIADNYLTYPFQHVISGTNCFVNSDLANIIGVKYEVVPLNLTIPQNTSYNKLSVKGSISDLIEESLNNIDKLDVNGSKISARGVLTPEEIIKINDALILKKYDNMAVLVTASGAPTVLLFGNIDCYESQQEDMTPKKTITKNNTTTKPKITTTKNESNNKTLDELNKKINGLENKINTNSDTTKNIENSYNTNSNNTNSFNTYNITITNNATKDTINIPVIIQDTLATQIKKNAFYLELGPEILLQYKNLNPIVPQIGLGLIKNNWSFGITLGYKQFNTEENKSYPNILDNGGTEAYNDITRKLIEYGIKANFNVSKTIYLGLGIQNNTENKEINSRIVQTVYDDAGNMRQKELIQPIVKGTNSKITLNPEVGLNLDKNNNWSIYTGAKLTPQKIHSGYAGIRYNIRK